MPNTFAPKQLEPLDSESASKLGGALARLAELQSVTVLTPATEAEIRGLNNYIETELNVHAAELLGAWFTVANEYRPLLNVVAGLSHRVRAILRNSDEAVAKMEAK